MLPILLKLPAELLLQIVEQLEYEDLLQLRQVSTCLREFTRVHSDVLVYNILEKRFKLEHHIFKESPDDRRRAKDSNRVLKIGIAAMMADPSLDVGLGSSVPRLLKWLVLATFFDHMRWRYRCYHEVEGPKFSSMIIWDEGRIERWEKQCSMVVESRYGYLAFLQHVSQEVRNTAKALDFVDSAYVYRPTMSRDETPLAILYSLRPTFAIFDKIHPELLWARGIRRKIEMSNFRGPYVESEHRDERRLVIRLNLRLQGVMGRGCLLKQNEWRPSN